MQKYIQQVNNIIEAFEIKGDKSKFRSKMLETLKADEHCFYITCDDLRSEEDVFIIKEILNLSSKIILLIRNEEKFSLLLKNYKNQIVSYDVSQLQYALSSDIHIFLYDKNLLQILYRFHKVFNTIHPKDYPLDFWRNIEEWGSREKREIILKEKSSCIKTRNDLNKYIYGDILNSTELEQFNNTSGIEFFLLQVKLSVKYSKFLSQMQYLNYMSVIYGLNNKKSGDNRFKNNFLSTLDI